MSLSRLALGAFLFLGLTVTPLKAADVGGTTAGLADLEERVAELETLAARHSNRKVSLTIYGQINRAITFHDADVPGFIAKKLIGDGSQSPTAFGFTGQAKASPTVTVGFKLEFGVDDNAFPDDAITVRHSALWIESVQMGRLTLGHTSTSTDGIVEVSTANVAVAAKMLSLEPVSTAYLFGLDLPFDGGRHDVVRWDSPTLGGFNVSASYGQGDRIGPITPFGNDSAIWDVAVRYAGEFGGFRGAAGVGYRFEDNNSIGLLGKTLESSLSGSASVMHMASGLFVNAAGGRINGHGLKSDDQLTGMHVQGGWEKNLTGLGTTTFYGEWAQLQTKDVDERPNLMGLGLVQAVDAAALDLYATWRAFDGDSGGDKINVFMTGARIRF